MSLNKRIRKKPIGKMSNQKEYPKLTTEQVIDQSWQERVRRD